MLVRKPPLPPSRSAAAGRRRAPGSPYGFPSASSATAIGRLKNFRQVGGLVPATSPLPGDRQAVRRRHLLVHPGHRRLLERRACRRRDRRATVAGLERDGGQAYAAGEVAPVVGDVHPVDERAGEVGRARSDRCRSRACWARVLRHGAEVDDAASGARARCRGAGRERVDAPPSGAICTSASASSGRFAASYTLNDM